MFTRRSFVLRMDMEGIRPILSEEIFDPQIDAPVTDYCDWSDPLGVSAWMNREARYYAVEALSLVTYFLDGAIDALMWLMSEADELSNRLDKES